MGGSESKLQWYVQLQTNFKGVERAREGEDQCCGGDNGGEFPVLKGLGNLLRCFLFWNIFYRKKGKKYAFSSFEKSGWEILKIS